MYVSRETFRHFPELCLFLAFKFYFPIQNFPKIPSKISLVVVCPVISHNKS